ncbi:MAG: hypothetical protein ACKVON_06350 [Beijerinckiaceae bacterium]
MSGQVTHYPETGADFEAIELAVMETERGRMFLQEYARRNRNADTQVLLTALSRIEKSISVRQEPSEIDQFRVDIIEMTRAIARTKNEIAAIQPDDNSQGPLLEASGELDLIVSETESATSDILASAEKVQEAAWTLREAAIDPALCDQLDEHATQIYTSCSFQDLTAQRTRKVIETLGFLESRLTKMAEIWNFTDLPDESSSQKLATPSRDSGMSNVSMSQADVDFVLVEKRHASPENTTSAASVVPTSAVQTDEMLFSREAALAELHQGHTQNPESFALSEGLKVVHRQAMVEVVPERASKESSLSADEAKRALDALKAMPLEDRTLLFS